MARKLFFLEDQRSHLVNFQQFQEVSRLALLEPGPYLVVAKGDLKRRGGQFNEQFEIRLDGFSLGGVHLGTDRTDFYAAPPHLSPGPSTFSLAMEVTVPFKGGGGIEEPPPHRAILSVRGGSSSAIGILTNVRIFAIPADEIVVTTLEPPPFVPVFPKTPEADVPT